MTALQAIAWLIALAWLWKAATAARGMPTIPNLSEPKFDREPAGQPSLTVIVPARNEAAALPSSLRSLLAQDYANLNIIAVNDRSTDATGEILDALASEHPAKLRVLHVTELPQGWLGKTHAMAFAARHAIATHHPDYLLFTDADVHFTPDALRRSLATVVETSADHFVTFPTPEVKTAGEGMLLGYLGVMGLWATRPWKVADPNARDFVGIGAFNLLQVDAYQKLGGFDALRMEILEDLTLAQRVKQMHLRQRVAVAPGMVTVHWAAGAWGVMNVMTKNLFAVFRFRLTLALAACAGIALLCLGPFAFLASAETRLPALAALASIAALYAVSRRSSLVAARYYLLFPAAAVLILWTVARSTATTLKDGGVTWRGTFYPLAELRKGISAVAR